MNKEALIVELDRLLDAGEPLLVMFPTRLPDGWSLKLPGSVSPEMRRYADSVALRARDRQRYQKYQRQAGAFQLARLVKRAEVGLLGWRAIGVLK